MWSYLFKHHQDNSHCVHIEWTFWVRNTFRIIWEENLFQCCFSAPRETVLTFSQWDKLCNGGIFLHTGKNDLDFGLFAFVGKIYLGKVYATTLVCLGHSAGGVILLFVEIPVCDFPLKHPVITLWTLTYPLWFTDYEWCSESPQMSFLKIMHLNMYHFLSITNVVLAFFDKEYGLTLSYLINFIFMSCHQ